MNRPAKGELTGRHVLIITLTAFGVIVTANMALVVAATGSFPGLVVDNSYRAGVGWNARADAQRGLGWEVSAAYDGAALTVAVRDAEGKPVRGLAVTATLGRPAHAGEDRALSLTPAGGAAEAGHVALVDLAPGNWRLAIEAEGGESPYRGIAALYVPERKG